MPLKVSDGIGAWIKDFQKSDAPQFKNSSKEERRDQAIAAYLSAKGESVEENVSAPRTPAHRRAMMGIRHSDLEKTKDEIPFDGPYGSTKKPRKDRYGNVIKSKNLPSHLSKQGIQKVVKSRSQRLVNSVREMNENFRTLATKGMGAEGKNDIKVGTGVDYYHPKTGNKGQGKVTKMTATHYHVKDNDTNQTHSFKYHDRTAAKKLLGEAVTYHGNPNKDDDARNAARRKRLNKRDPSKSGGSGYNLYHKDFSSAMQHAYKYAKDKLGVEIDPKQIDDLVASGPRKPSSGKTNSYSLLDKTGKKRVMIQVANLDNKKYELNMYKESVELDEAVDPKKVVAHLVKKGSNPKDAEKMVAKHFKYATNKYRASDVSKIADVIMSLGEAVLAGKHYKVKDGKVYISRDNFSKVHKDYKNATKGKERMTVLDPKSQATVSAPVVFEAKDMYKSAAQELKTYADKSGGMDKKDFHAAAKNIESIGKANVLQKGQLLAKFSKQLRDLDTSPREKILSVLDKHGHQVGDFMPGVKMKKPFKTEEVQEGSLARLKMIRKAGEKYNKEKKAAARKAERDAKRGIKQDPDLVEPQQEGAGDEGAKAARSGKSYSSNPYPKGSSDHLAWSKAHNQARARQLNMGEEFTMKHYRKNEDENRHSENALELAKKFGTEKEKITVKRIYDRHMKRGHITEPDRSTRDRIARKHYPKLTK